MGRTRLARRFLRHASRSGSCRASVRSRPASSCRHPGGSRRAPAASTSGRSSLSAAMSTATKPLDGRPLGAAIVVVALFVSDSGLVAPVALSKSIHDARYATGALRDAARDGRVLERQPLRIEARVDDRIHLRQVDALDLLAALDQHIGEILLGRRIAELPGVDGRPDHVVGERRDAPRRPERVVVAQLHVGGRRRLRPPFSRIEDLAFELADRRVLDVVDGLPRAQPEPEGEEALPRRADPR